MNTKSYTIVLTADGFTIMQTTVAWRVDAHKNCHITNMTVRPIETLRYDAGNNYEDAENRVRGWYLTAAIAMQGNAS